MNRAALFVSLAGIFACSPASKLQLLGEETWLSSGGEPTRVFDRLRTPRFIVNSGSCNSWEIELRDSERAFPADVVELQANETLMLHTKTSTRPLRGPGGARVMCRGVLRHEVSFEWRPTPEEVGVRRRLLVEPVPQNDRDARARIDDLLGAADVWTRTYAEYELARFHNHRGRREDAALGWLRAEQTAKDAGEQILAERMSYARVSAKYVSGDLDGARKLLAELPDPPSFERGKCWRAFFEGQIAEAKGELRAAEDAYLRSARLTVAQGEIRDYEFSLVALTSVLSNQGRWTEALVTLGQLANGSPSFPRSDLTKAIIHNLVGWTMFGAEQSTKLGLDLDIVENNFREARSYAERAGHTDARAHAIANLALLHLARNATEAAERELSIFESNPALSAGTARPTLRLARAEAALMRGSTDRAHEELAALSVELKKEEPHDLEIHWRAEHLAGRVFLTQGRQTKAEDAFRRALKILHRNSHSLAVEAGVHALWRRAEPALDLIDLLHRAGRDAEAFDVVDELHSSALLAIEQSSGKNPPTNITSNVLQRSLPEKTGILSMLRGPRGSWIAFLVDRREILMIDGSDPIAELLPRLATFRRLYVIPGGNRRAFDLLTSTLPSGNPLGASVEISLLSNAGTLVEPRAVDGTPLVVADPNLDLDAASKEGKEVSTHLAFGTILIGKEATREAVRAKWTRAGILHFAGHGEIDARRPWDAHLRLHDGLLTLNDVLADRPRPRLVVLAACESGSEMEPARLGLPHAFLRAGAETVLATIRRVEDEPIRRLVNAFYRHGGATDPHAAFRLTIEEAASTGDQTWTALRLWGGRIESAGESKRAGPL